MTVDAALSYFDFPFSQEAFCTGRGATSYRDVYLGVAFRHYGRNTRELTLVGWQEPLCVEGVLRDLAGTDASLKSVNFTHEVPKGLPTRRGPAEFRVSGDFDTHYAGRSGKTRQTILRACRGLHVRPAVKDVYGYTVALLVFNAWLAWAKTRHFMVFKGHYQRWLVLFFDPARPATNSTLFLYTIFDEESRPVGIFGGEVYRGEAQVTIAKHLPALSSKALWTLGLRTLLEDHSPTMVHCGSTADVLKTSLGFEPTPSWVPDLKAIKETT